MEQLNKQPEVVPAEPLSSDSQAELANLREENNALRRTIANLEQELFEVQSRTDLQVAKWQERAYWLDRWHLDLNALMRKRGADELLSALKVLRAALWRARALKRKLFPAPPRPY